MKTRLFNRRSIVFLFAIAVFFCSVQNLSFGQVELIVSDPASLTEATLDNSIVTLTLRGATFVDNADNIRGNLSVSGVLGVSVDDVRRLSDTEISVRLRFSGDFDQDATLTFDVRFGGIIGQAGSTVTDPISVTSTLESLTATPASLTEATLHNSTVRLTLRGRTFEDNVDTIRRNLSVSGVSGVSVADVGRHSDTEITVGLEFSGNLERDGTLTFRVGSWGIKNYSGSVLTDTISVTSTLESLTATPASLTEATLNNSTVTLTLRGRTFEENIGRSAVSVSGISGVSVADVGHLSDTEIRVRLEFSGDLDRDATLTFKVRAGGIKNYNRDLTTNIPVTTLTESLTATPASLTEATLNNSTVTLTLRGRTFENDIRPYVSVSGILGVSIDDVRRLSDTEVTVRLEFNRDFNRDATLTFRVRAGGIKNYNRDLTTNIPVTTSTESLTATPASLTEATLNNSTVRLTLRGRTFENNIRPYVSVSGISGVNVGNLRLLSNTEVEVPLNFNGDFDRDGTLTFRVRAGGIKNYNGSDLTANIPVSATIETQTPVGPTPNPTPQPPAQTIETQTPVGPTPNPTPQPPAQTPDPDPVVSIPDANLAAAIRAEIGNTLTTRTMLNLTSLVAVNRGVRNLTGLEHARNLQILYLGGDIVDGQWVSSNAISDVSPLSGLTQLRELYLDTNSISDVLPLSGLTQLTELYLSDNNISDVLPLSGLTQLTELDLSKNNISDVSPLSRLTQLRTLDLFENNISDVSPLSRLTQLRTLLLFTNNISDVSSLSRLTQLETLGLRGNPLNSASIHTHIPALQARGVEVTYDNEDDIAVENPPVDTRTPTVPIDPSQPAIYWMGRDGVKRANLDGSNVQTLMEVVDPFELIELTLDAAGGKMYWIHRDWETYDDEIQCANLDGSNVETLVRMVPETLLSDFTLDVSGGKMYWISNQFNENWEPTGGKIQRANLNGSQVETLVKVNFSESLTLDASSGKMYWISDDRNIQRANLDGSNVETLRAGEQNALDLALDVSRGRMYWRGVDRGDGGPVNIQHANLDGSNVQTLVTEEDSFDITLDVVGGKMYWVERKHWSQPAKIQRASLDGSNIETLVATRDGSYPLYLTLDVSEGKMYWVEWEETGAWAKIQRANLDGSNTEDIVTEDIVTDWGQENFALIPSQIIEVPSPKTVHVHVNAADRPPMYWIDTSAGTLHRLVDTEVENLVPSVRNATSLTLDVTNDKLYWTEKTGNRTGRIRSANLDGTNVRLVKDLTSVPLDITFNPADGKLYLTNAWGKVQRLNLNGSGFQPNLITGLDTPMNLAVDVANDKLYWTEKTGNGTGKIRSANFDGTNVRLVRDLTSVPLDMTLDAADGKLYLTNVSGQVQRINLDGSGFQPNFITGLNTRTNLAVDTAGQKLYLTSSDGKISRRNLSGGGSEAVVEGLVSPGNIVLNNSITTPGKPSTPMTPVAKTKYDVNGDGTVNDRDASLVSEAISNGSTDAKYDVNDDGKVNFDDLKLVLDNRERDPYDINEDGTVNDEDASLLTEAISNGSTDAKYDVNDDGKVNFDDLKLVLDNRAQGAAGAPLLVGNLKLTAAQMARIEAQIDLLIATGDRAPAAIRTLIYLQQLLTTARPEKTQLLANYPNPFNPETWIPYALVTDTNVKITIYNTQGIVIRTLQLGQQSAGYYTNRGRAVYWDGRNAQGEPVASGIYFYTLTAGDFTATRKMLIRK